MQENLGIHQFELNLCVQFEAKKAWQHLSKSNPMTEGIDKRDQKALRHVRMLHWHHGVIHFIVLRWLKLFFTAAISKKNLKKKKSGNTGLLGPPHVQLSVPYHFHQSFCLCISFGLYRHHSLAKVLPDMLIESVLISKFLTTLRSSVA